MFKKETTMAQTSSANRTNSDNQIYSRIKFDYPTTSTLDTDDFFTSLCSRFDAIDDVVYTERADTVVACVVAGVPTELDTTSLRDFATEWNTDESGTVEVWVRRVFTDELTEVQNGATLIE